MLLGTAGGEVEVLLLLLLAFRGDRSTLLVLVVSIVLGLSIVPTSSSSTSLEARNTPAFVSTPEKRLPTAVAAAVMCESTGISSIFKLLLLLLGVTLVLDEASYTTEKSLTT